MAGVSLPIMGFCCCFLCQIKSCGGQSGTKSRRHRKSRHRKPADASVALQPRIGVAETTGYSYPTLTPSAGTYEDIGYMYPNSMPPTTSYLYPTTVPMVTGYEQVAYAKPRSPPSTTSYQQLTYPNPSLPQASIYGTEGYAYPSTNRI